MQNLTIHDITLAVGSVILGVAMALFILNAVIVSLKLAGYKEKSEQIKDRFASVVEYLRL